MSDYIISVRNKKGNGFGDEPGRATYLAVAENASEISIREHSLSMSTFVKEIIHSQQQDIIFFIHGYNNSIDVVLNRHRKLKEGFQQVGYTGELITFAWPSGDNSLMYLEDRHDAKKTALELVNSCIKLVAAQQSKNCTINIHLLGHSTGAYVISEAFADADTTSKTADVNWTVSQILLISGDVSSDSMSEERGLSIYRHCNRLTNYYNPYDSALALSNIKRAGFKNRVGRVGLPAQAPEKAVDVNCGAYYDSEKDQLEVEVGNHSHSWYFYSETWFEDAFYTIKGDMNRNVIPTRQKDSNGHLQLATSVKINANN
ncbi:MAG: alpha/beta hydrolase [Bacteroidetes bacterium]|nr:alpha/beta hydrolase [Bacteroidota bacterium]